MNLIIFGAGASFGSDDNNPTPPLGDNLFDELEKFDGQHWGNLNVDWKRRFREDFESAMQAYIKSGNFAAPLQWSMAEYFFTQFHAYESNVYVKILKLIQDNLQNFTLATLNYDLLFQHAAALAGVNIVINSFLYTNNNQIRLILPHGSSAICCVGIRGSRGISFTGGISTGGRPRLFSDYNDFRAEKASNVFPPVMSYFEPNKFTVSCSNFITSERQTFAKATKEANKIAIIGMKLHISDKHIWDPLSETSAQILYLSGKNAAPEYKNWAREKKRQKDIISESYMKDAPTQLKAFFEL